MLKNAFFDVYNKFKLHFYQEIFRRFQDREASLTTVETFAMETIQALGRPTINEFATFMRISPPNAAYKINSLVKKGYIRKVQSPEDMHGQKIRVMENQLHIAIWEALGASPTPLAFSEVYMALQQGTIDAQENPLSVITSSRFNEVQDYLSMTEHVYSAAPLMVSKAAYDALPDDLKAIVDEAGTEACQWEREYLAEVEVQWLDELEAAGTQINYPDKAPFVEAMSSVYDEFVGDGDDMVSPELLEQVREIISQVE